MYILYNHLKPLISSGEGSTVSFNLTKLKSINLLLLIIIDLLPAGLCLYINRKPTNSAKSRQIFNQSYTRSLLIATKSTGEDATC